MNHIGVIKLLLNQLQTFTFSFGSGSCQLASRVSAINMQRFNISDSFSKDLDSEVFKDYMKVKYSDEKWSKFKPFVMSRNYEVVADKIKDFKVHCDDVFVCSFPRSGTTLLQEMVWLILHDLNYEKAKATVLDERFPEIE